MAVLPDLEEPDELLPADEPPDDAALAEVEAGYRSGEILTGQMKQMCIDRAAVWLTELAEQRDETAHLVDDFLAPDAKK